MNSIAMGIFALCVVVITLLQLLVQTDMPSLRAMKRVWGRSQGALMYFLSEVVIPLIFGVLFLARGLATGF